MDGLVLSVAIGFRNYGGDGLTEWIAVGIAIASFIMMSFFTFLIYRNFRRDTIAIRSSTTKATLDQARKLEQLLDDPALKDVREAAEKIELIRKTFVDDEKPLAEDDYKFFAKIEKVGFNFLRELETTAHLIECDAISGDLLSDLGSIILFEYEKFFEPIVEIKVTIGNRLPIEDPYKKYYKGAWSGATKLMQNLKEPTSTNIKKSDGITKRIVNKLASFR